MSQLVTQLYDPANQRNPTTINEIQTRLQHLQKGENAWEIADSLLRQPSAHHRFMGALTFTVKVNVSGDDLDEPTSWQILERLINHFIAIVDQGEQLMVVRKLASSLVTIFRHKASSWKRAIWQLAASLANGGYVSESNAQTVDFLTGVLPALNTQKATALVFFSVALAEEGLRLQMEPQLAGWVILRLVENIEDAFLLVQYIIQQITTHASEASSDSLEATLSNEVMGSWKTWLGVYGNHRNSDNKQAQNLAIACGQDVIEILKLPSFSENAASVLTSALENRSWAFDNHSTFSLSQILSDSIVTRHLVSFTGEDGDTDNMTYVDLLVAYVSHVSFDLFSDPMKHQNSQILAILHNIFKIPGYAAIDESATTRVLEYWGDIAEYLPDRLEPSESRYQIVRSQLAEVVLGMFNKLLYPTHDEIADFSEEDRSEFNAFRHEACDYLLSAYPILGIELVSVFQESATGHLQKLDWRGFEAAMFCLAQLSEAVDENGHADQCLDSIFGSEAFAQLCLGGETGIPLKARQTLVDSFGKYESYFERHSYLLPGVLNILFESLSFESCAQPASRSILTLSKSCSRMLTTELPTFLDRLDQFRSKPTATVSTMPKVLEGISTIIQKLDSDQEKVQTLERILGFFVQEANQARQEAASSGYDIARVHGHFVLSCIASVGKGLRSDGDEVINIDAAEEQNPFPPSFWNAGPGSPVQQLIMEAMRLLIVDFPVDSGIIDSACDILKAGYTESSGLFVFPPSLTVDFIKSFPLGISGTDVIMATASSFLASHSSHPMQIRDQAVQLIAHVSQLFASMLDNPDVYDPETANAGIDFLARLLPKYYPILFSLTEPLPTASGPVSQGTPIFALLLQFTLNALRRPEPLVLRSGSAFWIALIDLQGGSPEETAALNEVLERFIPSLCETLIGQIAGHCARSDLTFLSDVLRRTIFKKMALARPSLKAALGALNAQDTDANGNQTPVLSEHAKSRFVESLVVARGARPQSLEIVRSFWLKCRGMAFDYAQ
ncbi:Armadillo-like helical [Penicillium angulare]|uniref:Armadillo-like helical n=1 Tax=Penicillium angulare TaxID=116970 RepID=UPI0025401C10|nr:Armadillo-like helical [Penicillium angulare]KAJ5266597.1 Armadillo-like helical [Penicillium angulare]